MGFILDTTEVFLWCTLYWREVPIASFLDNQEHASSLWYTQRHSCDNITANVQFLDSVTTNLFETGHIFVVLTQLSIKEWRLSRKQLKL